MRLSVTLALLAVGLTTLSDATFIIETAAAGTASTVGVGTAAGAAALAGIGGLVLGAGIVGAIALSRRGKRSVENALKEDAIFNLVASSDAYGCAMKLVCMLEAKDDESLSDDDKFILIIFGRAPEAPGIDKMKSARGAYDYAAFMGHKFGVDACEELFHTCQATYETMIAYVAKLRA